MDDVGKYREWGCDVLLAGSMEIPGCSGGLGPVIRHSLESAGFSVEEMPFPQNTHRDERGYFRELRRAEALFHPRMILPVGDALSLARYGERYGTKAVILTDSAAKTELLSDRVSCSRLAESAGGKYLIEEYVRGESCSIDVIRWKGLFLCGCYRTVERRGIAGPATVREAVERPLLVSYAARILDLIDYRGVCGMDFIIDDEGRAFFLECNPRFTEGLATQIAAGFDIPRILAWQAEESFTRRVYLAVRQIPRGQTSTYGKIAAAAGSPGAARAVGNILHANPYGPEAVPCHRVLSASGKPGAGYCFGGPSEQLRRLAEEKIQ